MRALSLVVLAVSLFSIAGCTAPAPPTLTPKEVTVTGLAPDGIDFVVEVDAQNANSFALSVRNVTAHAKLDGKYDLGNVTVASTLEIPAGGTATVRAPLSVKWNDIGALGLLGASNRPIPFQVTGNVGVGSAKLNVDVPYKIDGVITHEQIVQALSRSIPGIQGLPKPFLPR